MRIGRSSTDAQTPLGWPLQLVGPFSFPNRQVAVHGCRPTLGKTWHLWRLQPLPPGCAYPGGAAAALMSLNGGDGPLRTASWEVKYADVLEVVPCDCCRGWLVPAGV